MRTPNTNQLWRNPFTKEIVIYYVDEVCLTWVIFSTKDAKGIRDWHMGPSALSGLTNFRRIA
jgi:hypothetical protein